jgi:hypothetical protein
MQCRKPKSETVPIVVMYNDIPRAAHGEDRKNKGNELWAYGDGSEKDANMSVQ